MQPVPCPSRRQRVAVGLRCEGEAVRYPDAPIRQSRIELAKRRVLSTHCRNVVQPNVAEPAHVPGGRHSRSLICAATILLGPGIHVLTQINGQGRKCAIGLFQFLDAGLGCPRRRENPTPACVTPCPAGDWGV